MFIEQLMENSVKRVGASAVEMSVEKLDDLIIKRRKERLCV